MTLHRYLFRLFDVLAAITIIVADFVRFALRVDYGHAWRFMREVGIKAFRKIGDLKPVYRDSYNTHGLSLAHDRYC